MAPRDPNDRRHVPMKARLEVWASVRAAPMAREAARLGTAWALKCAILNDAKLPGEINLASLARANASAAMVAARIQANQLLRTHDGRVVGIMAPPMAALALRMFDNLQVQEADTAEEILRHSLGDVDESETPS